MITKNKGILITIILLMGFIGTTISYGLENIKKNEFLIAEFEPKKENNNQQEIQKFQDIYKRKTNIGFKGLSLNMTRQEMDSLIKKTSWEYKNKKNKENTIYLCSDSSAPVEFGLIGEKILGDQKVQYHWQTTLVRLHKNIVFDISVFSKDFTANEIDGDLKNWLEVAYQALVEKYGEPKFTRIPISSINIFSFNSYDYICSWEHENQQLGLALYKSDFSYYAYIDYMDSNTYDEINKNTKLKTYM